MQLRTTGYLFQIITMKLLLTKKQNKTTRTKTTATKKLNLVSTCLKIICDT
jgi:hypothetical protein